MKRIVDRYIFKEMIPNFTTSLVVFTFLILAGRTLRLTEWMVNHGVSLAQVLLITGFTLPYVFFFTLPMATLLASLIAFSRLNEDNEITALRASGVSLYQLFPPVIIFLDWELHNSLPYSHLSPPGRQPFFGKASL